LTAVIVGGMGNDRGVTVGMFLIGILILQGVQFLNDVPALRALESYANRTGLIHDFGWIVLGTLTIVFIWLRPQGIFPERRPRYGGQPS
jgi:branched-chain amino acid transport system permease protein